MSTNTNNASHGGGLKFDPTINAGHLLTFAGFIIAGFVGWSTLDKRLVVVEQQRSTQEVRDSAQDHRSAEFKIEIKESLQRIERTIEIVRDKVEKR